MILNATFLNKYAVQSSFGLFFYKIMHIANDTRIAIIMIIHKNTKAQNFKMIKLNERIQFLKTVRDREEVTALGKLFQRAVTCENRILKIISMRTIIHRNVCYAKKLLRRTKYKR